VRRLFVSARSNRAVTVAATATSTETPVLGGGTEGLEAGAHVLELVAREQVGVGPGHASLPKIELTVPEGWFNFKGISVGKGSTPPQKVFVFFWDVAQVYPTPWKWKGKPMVDPGPDVNGLASAARRPATPQRDCSHPRRARGFEGKYLEMSVPSGVNFADCDEGYFESWTANGWGSDRYQQRPRQLDLWILDVDGERLVIDASTLPKATAEDRAELERVVDSSRFLD
jgi:hypothetical protein